MLWFPGGCLFAITATILVLFVVGNRARQHWLWSACNTKTGTGLERRFATGTWRGDDGQRN
ncbi:hypothetical protein EH228_16305 [Erwinia endophytica]|nr:hypothetical protein EH228_16305 [Erwinia endophytica]